MFNEYFLHLGLSGGVCGTVGMKLSDGLLSGGPASSPTLAADDGWQCDSASVGGWGGAAVRCVV